MSMEFKKNLAYRKEVKITTFVPNENSYGSVEKGTKDMLTDGKTGNPTECYSGEWAHFYRAVGRRLDIDLGACCAVDGFSIGFIQDSKMGIYCPREVLLLLSEDGKSYYRAASVPSPYPASYCNVRAIVEADFAPKKAKYAAIEFPVDVNVFCDELEIYGREDPSDAEVLCGTPFAREYKDRFAMRDSLGTRQDIPLIYYGYYPQNERIAKSKKEDFIPYIAYVDENGKMVDTLFDCLLFLPVQGKCPSGASVGYHGEASVLSDWQYLEDVLFEDGYSLKALDEAVGDMKRELSLSDDYRLGVYLTAPVPKVSSKPFGDINGDGIEEKLLTTDDCVAAYEMYVDGVAKRLEASHLSNISVEGYFWNNESASRACNDDEIRFATRCVDALHRRGLKCLFIPYYQAGGCELAEEIGFDCTTMQPNLSFNAALQQNPDAMMEEFTELCRTYGFGVELEIHHGVMTPDGKEKYGKIFDQYMYSCLKNGMMTDTVHTYYQCAGPGVFYSLAYSSDPYYRGLYTRLYKFAKGTLTEDDFETDKTGGEVDTKPISAATVSAESEPEVTDDRTQDTVCEHKAEKNTAADSNPDDKTVVKQLMSKIKTQVGKKDVFNKKLLIGTAAAVAAAGVLYVIKKAIENKED